MTRALLVILAVVGAVSCDGSEPGGTGDTGNPADTDTTHASTPSATDAEPETDEPRTIELDVSNRPSYDSGSGVTLTIDDARVGDITSLSADDLEEFSVALDNPDSRSLLVLTVTVTNAGDTPIAFYPDQGTALVGSEQAPANFLLSESFTGGGGSILDGATVTKDVYFELSQQADDVAALGQARYTASGPADEETFESLGDDVDLTVEWSGASG